MGHLLRTISRIGYNAMQQQAMLRGFCFVNA
jgi:hypothetical protein